MAVSCALLNTKNTNPISAGDLSLIFIVIDFGGATYDNDYKSITINTRQYRSPEVLLCLPWSYPSDMWGLGCILVEMYTGELLFGTHDNIEHLTLIEHVLGCPFPKEMVHAISKKSDVYKFFKDGKLRYENIPSKILRYVRDQPTLTVSYVV